MTIISRFLGLAREMVRAWLLGTSYYSDAFIMAFSLPNLFRRLTAEGAMVNAFIPTYHSVRLNQGDAEAKKFAGQFFSLLLLVLSLLCAAFIISAPWLVEYVFAIGFTGDTLDLTVLLTRFMFVYILFISLAALCQGVLNSHSVFWVSAFTPILLNISIIFCAWFFQSYFSNPTYGFALGVVLGGFVQFIFQTPFVKKSIYFFSAFSLKNPHIREVGRLMLPGIFGVGIYQINIIISNLIASTLGEGAVSSLSFSNRILELVLGVFVVSFTTVIFPKLTHYYAADNQASVVKHMREGLRMIAFVVLPVLGGIWITCEELVELLFKRGEFNNQSLLLTVEALRFHVLGLLFIGWNRLIVIGFQAGKNFKTPVKVAGIVLLVNLLGCLLFPVWYGHAGIALAATVSQAAQIILLFFLFNRQIQETLLDRNLMKSVWINLSCTGIMVLSVWYAKQFEFLQSMHQLINYGFLLLVGAVSFLMACLILKNRELLEINRLIKNRNQTTVYPEL